MDHCFVEESIVSFLTELRRRWQISMVDWDYLFKVLKELKFMTWLISIEQYSCYLRLV